jgi:putative lipoprotein
MKFPYVMIALIAAVLLVTGCQSADQNDAAQEPVEQEAAQEVPTREPPTAAPPTAEPEVAAPVVTGAVTTAGAVALPEGATISVKLFGVSTAGVTLVSDQSISTQGQLPAAFVLAYNEADIDPNHLYTVHAEIKDTAGNLLFVSTGLFPVITFGNPTTEIRVEVFPITTPPGEEPAPGTPPVVTATLNPYEAAAGDTVDVYTHATATDGAGIVKLELYIDDEMTSEWNSDSPEGVPYTHQTFTLRDVQTGEYVIRVKAIDTQGDEGWSADEKLTVE